MPTLKQEFIYFNDAVGRTLPNAKMYFYEAGTTTPKNTFTSKSLANANQHPVVADAAGRFPVIWLGVGGYRVVVEDENGVTIHDRDDINVADEQLNATSSIYFKTLADLKLLIAQNGQSVNPGIGDALRTAGETTTTDDLGAEWVVVAAGTGTADDDLFVDLDNGLQAQRLFNQLYVKNNLSEIADGGAADQEAASGNIDALYAPNNLQEIEDAGASAQQEGRENLGLFPDAYQTATVDITTGGSWGTGSEIFLERIGKRVTITTKGILSHASSGGPNTAAGAIPAAFRPTTDDVSVVYDGNTFIGLCRVTSAGEFNVIYRDFTGAGVNRTDTNRVVSITYSITP